MESIDYRIGNWDSETRGNHRVLINVESEDKAAAVSIPWRRSDSEPEQKGILIHSRKSGESVDNIFVRSISKEKGEIAFETISGTGIYEVYYMKYEGTTRAPYPVISYPPQETPADKAWQEQMKDNWNKLERAVVVAFEACDELHSFYPMEISATDEEVNALVEDGSDHSFLIFPEVRENPIIMRRDLPFQWIGRGPFQDFSADVSRDEYFVFQLGLYAHKQDLNNIGLHFSDLQSDGQSNKIQADNMTCFNLEGVSCKGEHFDIDLSLPGNEVQALWIGIKIPEETVPGQYEGYFSVTCRNTAEEKIRLILNVQEKTIEAGGDDDPYRLSRLRWLNSTLGSEDKLIRPYAAVERKDKLLKILGREISVGFNGLPASINSFFTQEITGLCESPYPIISSPIEFFVYDNYGGKLEWNYGKTEFTKESSHSGGIRQTNRNSSLVQNIEGILDPDGCLEYNFSLEALEETNLKDTILQIPFNSDAVKYILGLGFTGGLVPESFIWKWDTANKNQDSVWIGSEQGGLQISLKDENYRRPLNTNFYKLQPLVTPRSWDNGGKGSISFEKSGDDFYMLKCSGGDRIMEKGDLLHFNFRILITPFRPIDTDKQWNTRFYHKHNTPEEIKKSGANTVNLHHATPVNPFINYPFLKPVELKKYADKVHELDMKLRLYYTVRELTNHAPEIFALKSLGNEIFTNGPGGGHSWLQEHFRENYIAAWHVYEYGCVAVANNGTSRWHNFYVEGLDWLARNMEIDGVYIDDLAFDRDIMKRVRRVLDEHRDGAIIDLHSANQFNEKDGFANSINMYMEHLPYIDKVWFGEYFDYSKGPDYWMTEVSGIPFGTMGEMLQDGGHLWRGLLYGMTSRYPHEGGDPRVVWKVWKDFGMENCQMVGYWSSECPVRTSHKDILATVYKSDGRVLVSIASWAENDIDLELTIDYKALGLNNDKVRLITPYMKDKQAEKYYSPSQSIPIGKNEGALIILEEELS